MEIGKIEFSQDGKEAIVEVIGGFWFFAYRKTMTHVLKGGFWEEKLTGKPSPTWIVMEIRRRLNS